MRELAFLNRGVNLVVRDKTLKKEKGCTEPLYGKKAKCVLNIVPQSRKVKSLNIDKKCIKTRKSKKK